MNDLNIDAGLGEVLSPIVNEALDVAKPLTSSIKGVLLFVCRPALKLGIRTQAELDAYEDEINRKAKLISPENIYKDNVSLIGKILEDSIYQLSEEQFRELYSSIIAASVDKTKVVKPFYSSLIREMSSDEVNLLEYMFEYDTLIEMNISCDNPMFIKENTYHEYWEPRYFKIKGDYSNRFKLRDFNDPIYEKSYKYDKDFVEDKTIESFNFLLSHGVIKENRSEYWNEFIPSIKKFIFDTDDDIIRAKQNFPDIKFEIDRKVYSLTELGKSLKTILTAYRPEVLN